jgi:hypothetical protein
VDTRTPEERSPPSPGPACADATRRQEEPDEGEPPPFLVESLPAPGVTIENVETRMVIAQA